MIRVIKESVSTERRGAICELPIKKDIQAPMIVVMNQEKSILIIYGNDPYDKYINLEKVSSDLDFLRLTSRINSGVVYTNPKTPVVRIYGLKHDLFKVDKEFVSVMIDVFKRHNVDVSRSSHREFANDFVFVKDGREKKFGSMLTDLKYKYFGFFISLSFDSDNVRDIYKLDTVKMRRRGVVNDISEIVGGINEINPDIDASIIDEIILELANRMGWGEVVQDKFTEEEEQYLKK